MTRGGINWTLSFWLMPDTALVQVLPLLTVLRMSMFWHAAYAMVGIAASIPVDPPSPQVTLFQLTVPP